MINSKYYFLVIIIGGFISEPCRTMENSQPFSHNNQSYKENEKIEVIEEPHPITPLEKNKNIITNEIKEIKKDVVNYIKDRKEDLQLKRRSFTDSEIEKEKDVVYQRAMIEDLKKLRQEVKPELTDNEVDILINRIQLKYYPEEGDGI